jgi:acetoin utilization protein AcuB
MNVAECMIQRPIVVGADDFLSKAEARMKDGGFRRLPVVHEGMLVGIVTDRDLRQYQGVSDKIRVHSVMTHPVRTVAPSDKIETAARLMLQHRIGGLPVVQDGEVLGIVTTGDLLRLLIEVLEGRRADAAANSRGE